MMVTPLAITSSAVALLLFTSNSYVASELKVSEGWIATVPGLVECCFPGTRTASRPRPDPTVTAPAMLPTPTSVPPLTYTGPRPVAESPMLLTISLPRLTVVPPVYVFLWLRTSCPFQFWSGNCPCRR